MKNVILFCFLGFHMAQAAPVKLEGLFKQTGEVQPLTRSLQQIVFTQKSAQDLIAKGYGCSRVESKFRCIKAENISEIPDAILQAMKAKAAATIKFDYAAADYSLSHESEVTREWFIYQKTSVDGERFGQTYWRQLQGHVEKIRLVNDSSIKEFIWLGQNQMGLVQEIQDKDEKNFRLTKYWGSVVYALE